MQIAHFLLRFNRVGSNLPKRNITPPEYRILLYEHGANAGGNIIEPDSYTLAGNKNVVAGRDENGKVNKTRDITGPEELALLKRRYKASTIAKLYPGDNPTLPTTFKEVGVDDNGIVAMAESAKTVEVINGDDIEVVPLTVTVPKMAPATDSVSNPRGDVPDPKSNVERRAGSPGDLAFALGSTVDDGGRAVA